jgi:diguanylate cyclase (GGDEF)-like protein
MKLQAKILVLLVPLIVAPLAIVGYVAYYQLQDNVQQNSYNEMRLVLNQVESRFSENINTAISNVELFSSSFLVEKYALTTDEAERYGLLQRPLLNLYASYQQAYPGYYEIRFLLPDGYEAARRSTRSDHNLTEEEAADDFIESLYDGGRDIETRIRLNPDNGELALYVGKALYLRDDSIDPLRSPEILRGSLVITDSLEPLRGMVTELSIGKSGKLLLLDRDGHSYYVNDEDPILNIPDDQLLPENIVTDLYAAVDSPGTLNMGDRSFRVSAIELYPGLLLVAVLPDVELLAVTSKLAVWVAGITAITIILFSALLLMSLRYLVIQPLQKLNKASYAIARGNMDVRVDVPGNDEISSLADSFCNMAQSLSESHAQVRYMAHHDALTGLPNRHMFKEYFSRTLAQAKRNKSSLALMFIDIDEFKHVNDTLGHEAGDRLLEDIADRLGMALRDSDLVCVPAAETNSNPRELVARIGGDEFTLLLPDIAQPEQASKVAQRILDILKPCFTINKHKFYVGGSIGITLYPQDGQTTDELIKNADLAMYKAKRAGKNTYRFFEPEMNEQAMRRIKMESRLRQAIENNDFVVHYQPLIDIADGRITGLEALVRWRDRDSGELISPNDFIPLAEETGLIIPIGEWVMNEACSQLRKWMDKGIRPVQVSVNASSIQLAGRSLPQLIQSVLERSGLPAQQLEIELTETSVMSAGEEAVENLYDIKKLGISIALDDFGTGYSSLSYLRDFAIDKLKIDRSFIDEIGKRSTRRSLVAAIIVMSHTLDLKVVAEGIEETEQLAFLRQHNCDIAQGFLFSKPLPADEIEALLENGTIFIHHFDTVN